MPSTASVHTLRNEYARLIAQAQRGHSITLLHRGKPVARLVPPEPLAASVLPVDWSASAALTLDHPKPKEAAAIRNALADNKGRY